MKKITLIAPCLLALAACTGSPSIDNLLENKTLMAEIQRAAKEDNLSKSVLPISIDVDSLVRKNLISKTNENKIRDLTNCANLQGIQLIVAQGIISRVDANTSKCDKKG